MLRCDCNLSLTFTCPLTDSVSSSFPPRFSTSISFYTLLDIKKNNNTLWPLHVAGDLLAIEACLCETVEIASMLIHVSGTGADGGYTKHWGSSFAKDMLHKRCIPGEDFFQSFLLSHFCFSSFFFLSSFCRYIHSL